MGPIYSLLSIEKGDTVYISFFLWWLLYSGIPMQAGRVFRLEGGRFRGDS